MQGQVSRIEVVNNSIVRVYVRSLDSDIESLGNPTPAQGMFR